MATSSTFGPSSFSFSSSTTNTASNRNKTVHGYSVAALHRNTTVVTGYPHVRPPPQLPQPIYLHQLFHHHNQDHRTQLLRQEQALLYRLTIATLCFLLFMGCLLFTFWLYLCPRLPHAHLAFATLSLFSTNNTNVSIACNVSLLLTNPNRKFTVFYDNLELFLHYQPQQVPLFQVQVPPFTQSEKNDTLLRTHMEISNESVGIDVVKTLKEDLFRGSLSFGVNVFALMRLESKDWKTRSHSIKVSCHHVILGFSSENRQGTLMNPYKDCQVTER